MTTTQMKRRQWSKKDQRLLKDMYLAGVHIDEIAKVLQRTRSAVYKKCFMMGLDRKNHVHRPTTAAAVIPTDPAIIKTETTYEGTVSQKTAPSWFKKLLGNMIGVEWSEKTQPRL